MSKEWVYLVESKPEMQPADQGLCWHWNVLHAFHDQQKAADRVAELQKRQRKFGKWKRFAYRVTPTPFAD
jgi:hypothetical protein